MSEHLLEGEEAESFLFYLHGEVELEGYTEDEAWSEMLDMSLRELLSMGLKLD